MAIFDKKMTGTAKIFKTFQIWPQNQIRGGKMIQSEVFSVFSPLW